VDDNTTHLLEKLRPVLVPATSSAFAILGSLVRRHQGERQFAHLHIRTDGSVIGDGDRLCSLAELRSAIDGLCDRAADVNADERDRLHGLVSELPMKG